MGEDVISRLLVVCHSFSNSFWIFLFALGCSLTQRTRRTHFFEWCVSAICVLLKGFGAVRCTALEKYLFMQIVCAQL